MTTLVMKGPSEQTKTYMVEVLNRLEARRGFVSGYRPREIAERLGFVEGEFNRVYSALWHLVREGVLGFHRPRGEYRHLDDGDRPLSYRLLHKVR